MAAAQPDEVGGAPDTGRADPTPQAPAAPRPAPTPSGPRGWLHRMRRTTQPTPADPDPDAVGAGPRHEVTLGRRSPFAIGFFVTLVGFVSALVLIVLKLSGKNYQMGWPSMACMILIASGMQLFCIGLIGTYLGKTYVESKRRPLYAVRARHGLAAPRIPSS